MPTTLSELAINIHAANKKKGWYDDGVMHPSSYHMLIVTEIAEATEAVRNGEPAFYLAESGKPEGEAVEIIDAMIRILDYCGQRGWDVDEIMKAKLAYNKTRPTRHGGKTF